DRPWGTGPRLGSTRASCGFRKKVLLDPEANSRWIGCSISHDHPGALGNACRAPRYTGRRISSDILAAATRFTRASIQTVQISDNERTARRVFEAGAG